MRLTSRKARMSAWSVLLRIWVRCRFLRQLAMLQPMSCVTRGQHTCSSHARARQPVTRCKCVADIDYTP